ncbi:hypothetical protein TcasGA2_TC005265 [Tribolium castaneum]|uniref:DUF8207 domain-containing protein n=1 Tax=Tribolium castaneum TaxID=7070 RepID=D7ELN1_TRICA|nr:hypothetical protein TcasGA2_TC005265 [Tribolium castaneum]
MGTKPDQNLKRHILKAADSIRKKYKAIKLNSSEADESIKKLFQPVINPLEEISIKLEKQSPPPQQQQQKQHKRPKHHIQKQRKQFLKLPKKEKIKQELELPVEETYEPSTSLRQPEEIYESIPEIKEEDEETKSDTMDDLINSRHILDEFLEQYPPVARNAIEAVLEKTSDQTFGPRYNSKENKLFMGKHELIISQNGDLILDNESFPGTPGLYRLIFFKNPEDKYTQITKEDRSAYKKILEISNTHRKNNDPTKQLKGHRGVKYTQIVQPMFTSFPKSPFIGEGLFTNKRVEYVYWDDINELVSRLALLHAATKAGNNSHLNEILSIEEELKECGVIY